MKGFFKNLFRTRSGSSQRPLRKAKPAGFKPNFDHLEDRRLMSVSSLLLGGTQLTAYAPATQATSVYTQVVLQSPATTYTSDPSAQAPAIYGQLSGSSFLSDLTSEVTASGTGIDWAHLVNPVETVDYGHSIYDDLSLPILNSNPGAPATIYLNFTGDFQASWSTYTGKIAADGSITNGKETIFQNISTGVFDTDYVPARLNRDEVEQIREVWARVAEDYAPFNINVTTVKPASAGDGWTITVNIGDSYGWYNNTVTEDEQAVGISNAIGAFSDNVPDVAFAFTDALRSADQSRTTAAFIANIAETASHEAGHILGLAHHIVALPDGTDGLDKARSGQGLIMGDTWADSRNTWGLGIFSYFGKNKTPLPQWDIGKIASAANGFGFRADDYGDGPAQAKALSFTVAGVATVKGIIGIHPPEGSYLLGKPDVDVFSFTASGGPVTINADVLGYKNGANLIARVELWSDAGLVAWAGASGNGSSGLTANLAAGKYYVKVMSGGGLTDVGQYTLTVNKPGYLDVATIEVNSARYAYLGSLGEQGSAGYGANSYVLYAASMPGQLQARLGELDQAVAQNQQALQGALGLQTQYIAYRDRLDADILAALEAPPEELSPNLADLQAGQLQIMAVLEQSQQQIDLLQSQLDLFTAEQTLVGSALQSGDLASSSLTSVQSSDPVAGYGTTVTWVATVTGAALEVPTGTVTFFDNDAAIGTVSLDASGQASFSATALTVGAHAITASYDGDGTYQSSLADSFTQTITLAATTIAVQSSSPATTYGAAITWTATVSGDTAGLEMPEGTVTFFDNGVAVGTSSLDAAGQASFTTANLNAGSHAITASYDGAGNFEGSVAESFTQTVAPAVTQTIVQSSTAKSALGQSVTFTATVSGVATPTGRVTFRDGSTVLGTATLTNGVATFRTTGLVLGSHSITATFTGATGNFAASKSTPLAQVIAKASQTTVASSLTTSAFGQAITLTARVAVPTGAGVPAGTVTFKDGVTVLGKATLNGGVATLSVASLTPGTHSITAIFDSSTGTFAGSASATLSQVVNKAATTTTLSGPATAISGKTVILTAKIEVVAPGAGMPTGTVIFKDGATVLGTGTVINGVATFQTSKLSKGKHTITAVASGDAKFLANASTSFFVTIQ